MLQRLRSEKVERSLVRVCDGQRPTALGLQDRGRTSYPGLRDVRVAHIAPPWADIGLYLRHGSDGEHNNADSSPEGPSLSSLAFRVGIFLPRDPQAHTSSAESRGVSDEISFWGLSYAVPDGRHASSREEALWRLTARLLRFAWAQGTPGEG